LKDTVLASAAIALIGSDGATHESKLPKFKALFSFGQSVAGMLLRISVGVVLLWIGCIHLIDPQPVVTLLSMSLPFLAFDVFVYLLGALEVLAGSCFSPAFGSATSHCYRWRCTLGG